MITQDLSAFGIESLTTDGEWRLARDNSDLSEVRQFVFARMLERSKNVVAHYVSDHFHDAMWVAEHVTGTDPVVFWYVFDESGTHIGQGEPLVARFRRQGVRITVEMRRNGWPDDGMTYPSHIVDGQKVDTWIKIETIHRPDGFKI